MSHESLDKVIICKTLPSNVTLIFVRSVLPRWVEGFVRDSLAPFQPDWVPQCLCIILVVR